METLCVILQTEITKALPSAWIRYNNHNPNLRGLSYNEYEMYLVVCIQKIDL